MPPLGCGLGGLQWNSVKLLIDKYLSDLNTNIEVYIGSTNDFGESSGKSA
jgi:hypothetical protein